MAIVPELAASATAAPPVAADAAADAGCVKGIDFGIIFDAAEINESIDSGRNI